MAEVVVGAVHFVEVDPRHGDGLADGEVGGFGPVAGVGGFLAGDDEGLETSAVGEFAGSLREETVEQTVAEVFGFIDGAGFWIDGDGFVAESAHGFERDGIDEAGGGGGDDLEVVAVEFFGVGLGEEVHFFAGDPGAPRGRAAGAVADGAGEAEEVAFEFL